MEYMKTIPDKYFDLVIADPPYGIDIATKFSKVSGVKGKNNLGKKGIYELKNWDKTSPDKDFYSELIRISRNQIIFGANHFIEKIPYSSSCWIVWNKLNSESPFADCELAWTSFKTSVRMYEYRWNGMLQGDMKNKEVRIHPTQKPVKLYEWILKNYAKAGDKIFDPMFGSGSSRIACHKHGFEWTGCELDKHYFDLQEKRFKEYSAKLELFSNKEAIAL